MTFVFSNILGRFVFDKEELDIILSYFKKSDFHSEFYLRNIELTRKSLKDSVKFDVLVIQTVHCLEELEVVINKLSKVLREWYELHNPETSKITQSHEKFAALVASKSKNELLNEINVKLENSIGADLDEKDLEPIKSLASHLQSLFELKREQESYLESLMKNFCPNLAEVAGISVGSKLIEEAGSMKRLSDVPASTIQIFGAEKALFRHMKTGAKMPRHGLIANHPLIMQAEQKMHGKIARALADKISIAARVDYFKGNFVGDELKKSLIKKFRIEY